MNNIASILQQTPAALRIDAEVLLAYIMFVNRTHLYAHPEKELSQQQISQFQQYWQRRQQGEPLAYILGEKEFWGLTLKVTPSTLIPRPETESLVSEVLAHLPTKQTLFIADLGTGCGTIALALASERPHWQITATDISQQALHVAQDNAKQLGIDNVAFAQGQWCHALGNHTFHCIVSNPPYIAEGDIHLSQASLQAEPQLALRAGQDGLAALTVIIEQARRYLRPQGYLLVEHGFDQGKAVRALFSQYAYYPSETKQDLAGNDRLTVAVVKCAGHN